jgi:hypothetical protein
MAAPSLYRRILGPRFDALPEVLRRFHDTDGGGLARGIFRVERRAGRLGTGLASLLGMPEAGPEVPVRLQVKVEGEQERWIRHFRQHCLETVQWARGDLLMEALGRVSFSSVLVVKGERLRYEFQRAWYAGLPILRWLSPSVASHVDAGETGWRVVVRIFVPVLGEIVRYEGWIEPE